MSWVIGNIVWLIDTSIIEKIQSAYELAKKKYSWMLRNDGSPVFNHSIDVICKVFTYFSLEDIGKLTPEDIVVFLLHDIIEDSDVEFVELYKGYWWEIAFEVHQLSKKSWTRYLKDIKDSEVSPENQKLLHDAQNKYKIYMLEQKKLY